MAAALGTFSAASRLKTFWPAAMNPRISPVCACLSNVLRSAPAMKIDFFAEATITPLIDASFSIASTCSRRLSIVAASKMFAPDSGRSKVRTQIPAASISRRIIGPAAVAVIRLILARFAEIPSGESALRCAKPSAKKLGGARGPGVQHWSFVMVGKILLPEIRDLIAERNFGALRELFREMPPADVAEVILDLPEDEQVIIFRLLPNALAADVFEYLEAEPQQQLLRAMAHEQVVAILNEMSPDDRTALLEEMPSAAARQLIKLLTPDERRVAQALLGYPEASVGRLMTPDFIAIHDDWTVREVLDHIREFDILHFHIDQFHFPLFRPIANRTVTTLHGRQDLHDMKPLYVGF